MNFEIIFRNLEHVILWRRNFIHLWSAVIGRLVSVHKYRMKRRRCIYIWLSKVCFQCESAYFQKKISKFLFRNKFPV